jgi:hypothetical protein
LFDTVLAVRNKTPKIALLLKRILASVKDVDRSIQHTAEKLVEAAEVAGTKQNVTPQVRAEITAAQGLEVRKSKSDALDDRHYQNKSLLVSSLTLFSVLIYSVLVYFQWREMIAATGATQDAVHEARLNRQQAQKSLDAAIDQFHLDQRAWVGLVEGSPARFKDGNASVYVKEGENTQFFFLVGNSGKTPALKTTFKITAAVLASDAPFVAKYEKPVSAPTVGVVQPGVKFPLNTLPSRGIATKEHIDALKSGKWIYYIYGIISYEDVFERKHQTSFCVYLTPSLDQMLSCGSYNSAD